MPKRVTTAPSADRIKCPARGQVAHFVVAYPGLALRCSYRGAKTWVYFYRSGARQRKFVLGHHPAMKLGQAQDAWRAAREVVRGGGDPGHRPVPVAAHTFETAFEEWMKRDQAENRSRDETRGIIERDALPSWRDWPINDIGRAECLTLIDAIADSGRMGLARRLHRHLHRLFQWSVGRGIIDKNPMAALDMPGEAVKRERVFDDAELKRLWDATAALDATARDVVRLLILTGARVDEIAGLRWEYVDLEAGELRLPSADIKNKEPHVIPLTETTKGILAAAPRLGEFVFGRGGKCAFSNWGPTKRRVLAALDGDMPYWQWRDIRRTVRTGLSRLRVPHDVREMVIGHKKRGLDAVYDRYDFLPEKRAALEVWGRLVATVVEGQPANVVPLHARTA